MLDKFGPQSAGVAVSSADLQLKLTDSKTAGMGMEPGSGNKLIEITGPALSKRNLLVGLDLLCLFLGKYTETVFTCLISLVSAVDL